MIAGCVFFIFASFKNWDRFDSLEKIPIYGNFIFLTCSILEIIISRITLNMSVPLIPIGGLILFISLILYSYKLYLNIEARYRDLIYIKESRSQRDPDLRNKCLMGIDLKKVRNELEILMQDEKLFCDEDLSLTRLADILEVRPDQLSQIINDHYKNTFTRFINDYRISLAKNLLLEGENKILQVAYQVGFQSKSTFNSEFKKITGMTPKEYILKLRTNPVK